MSDKEFPRGLFVQRPRPNAPDFVIGRISIKVEDFLEYLSTKDGQEWLRIDIKEGFTEDDSGRKKWYSQVDNWKPSRKNDATEDSDALPF